MAIARAIVKKPEIIFADEPTGNLDSRTSEEVLRMFQQLNEENGITIIIVTHDPNVAKHARVIIQIHDGVIVSSAFRDAANLPEQGAVSGGPLSQMGGSG